MTTPFGFVGFALDEESSVRRFDRRQKGCVQCADVAPACPDCPQGQVCKTIIPLTCTECSTTVCVVDTTLVNSKPTSSGPSTGAIVGGVVGGLVAVGLITYLVWRFCIKTRRGEYEVEQWQDEAERSKEGFVDERHISAQPSKRASTHTVHSIASTVLTRASNIIQIAYIPGVTNRAAPNSPTLLVPPVPPIPIAHSDNGSINSPYEDQHFFVPGDLRNSTYSGISTFSDRTSYARTSYAPRSSVASTIYGKNAVVSPMPAQKGNFLKPSLVSVKSRGGGSSDGETAPPVPTINYERYDRPPPSPAFSIGSTFLKNASASTATTVRPQMISVSSGPKTIEIKSKASSTISTPSESGSDSPKPLEAIRDARKERDSNATTIIDDSPIQDQGPFADPPKDKLDTPLASVAEETASKRSSQQSKASTRGRSPFGDENAMR